MDEKLRQQLDFHLTGRRDRSGLLPMGAQYRPALLAARYADLTALRYDFPLVLDRGAKPDQALLSLSRLVDDALAQLPEGTDRQRAARHAYRIESELRRTLTGRGPGNFAALWDLAVKRLAANDQTGLAESAATLWHFVGRNGDLVDVDAHLPARVVQCAWTAVNAKKALMFRARAERLLLRLREILGAETMGSAAGWTPECLAAGVGHGFARSFDFGAMSQMLTGAKRGARLSSTRRGRVQSLIDVLQRQKFYALDATNSRAYGFVFSRCADALRAYQERQGEAVELVRALAVAELEVRGEYREPVHDILFEAFGLNGLDARQLAELPDYLVCTNSRTPDAAETALLLDALAAGLPMRILVQTDDCLEPPAITQGHAALGVRARQLAHTAMGLTDVYVLQLSASRLYPMRDALLKGMGHSGPTLISVFSGANNHTGGVPPYLVAAAAVESRVFPTLVFDPAASPDTAARPEVQDNPQPDRDWPVYEVGYEDGELQVHTSATAFTLADFMAMDERFFQHMAIVPRTEQTDAITPLADVVRAAHNGLPERVPAIPVADRELRLLHAIVDHRTVLEARRCLTMWRNLGPLTRAQPAAAEPPPVRESPPAPGGGAAPASAAKKSVHNPDAIPGAERGQPPAADAAHDGVHAYIETSRCSSCNECIQRNSRMFAYNENKQAYIADPDAGTFRQLVEAAEACQVSIIHPGQPRNPKEPGLDELLQRAAKFNT
jgi:hypothetical protein